MARITIDTEKCVRCGDCADLCPVRVYSRTMPPCQRACPVGTDAEGYLSLIAQGDFEAALALNRLVNPLPLTVGRICSHPCETKCHRGQVDQPIAICSLKRFVGDVELKKGSHQGPIAPPRTHTERIAVVGSGPAGLAAAHELAQMGYSVTIFEAEPVAGGMLTWGIPEFRLPKDIVRLEVADVEALGVEIRTATPVGAAPSLEDLRTEGFKAVLVAIGAQQCRILGIPGETGPGVLHCLELMRRLTRGEKVAMAGRVVVIGGGNVAVDGARTALRLGAEKVTIICLESRETMPAGRDEVEEAEEEGIEILPSRQCLSIERKSGAVAGVACIRLKSMRFDAGNLVTDPIAGSEETVPADVVVVAIGQAPDAGALGGLGPKDVGRGSRLVVNQATMSMSKPWLFAAGDAVSGPATVIEAIAGGKRAAASIDRYLRKESGPSPAPAEAAEEPMIDKVWGNIVKRPREATDRLGKEDRAGTFKEVDRGFDAARAVSEAKRCLGCGVFGIVDIKSCCGQDCALCMDNCWKQAITVTREPPPPGGPVKRRRSAAKSGPGSP